MMDGAAALELFNDAAGRTGHLGHNQETGFNLELPRTLCKSCSGDT